MQMGNHLQLEPVAKNLGDTVSDIVYRENATLVGLQQGTITEHDCRTVQTQGGILALTEHGCWLGEILVQIDRLMVQVEKN